MSDFSLEEYKLQLQGASCTEVVHAIVHDIRNRVTHLDIGLSFWGEEIGGESSFPLDDLRKYCSDIRVMLNALLVLTNSTEIKNVDDNE